MKTSGPATAPAGSMAPGTRVGRDDHRPGRLTMLGFRLVGGCLIVLAVVPFHRALSQPSPGLGRNAVAALAVEYSRAMWLQLVLVVIVALTLALLFRRIPLTALLSRIGDRIARWNIWIVALALAGVAGALTTVVSIGVLGGQPVLIDAIGQLVHARYLAAGRLAGPSSGPAEFWTFQYMLTTPEGWVSQYPPGHAILLALGVLLGAPWVIGPLLAAATVFFTALVADRLLPEDRGVARLGVALLAISGFFLSNAAAFMNHVSAAAFAALGLYCALRAAESGLYWAVGAGAAAGLAFATRPLAAVITACVVMAIWLLDGRGRGALKRMAAATAGGAPFAAAVAAYNARFFGHALRFGYIAAQGPAHDLGFHRDPWGSLYGLREAIGYTSADLLALGMELLLMPVSAVLVVGAYLLIARRFRPGLVIILLWALLPVVANAFYWHHDLTMGPRMLAEAAPAWAILVAVAAIGLVRRFATPMQPGVRPPRTPEVLAWLFLLAAAAGPVLVAWPRVRSYANLVPASTRRPPQTEGPSLVFVHEPWGARLGARLAAHGMRLDSVYAALRLNPPCRVQQLVDGFDGGGGAPAPDVARRMRFSTIAPRALRPTAGAVDAPAEVADQCEREMRADRVAMAYNLPPLLWQGDLPGLLPHGAMFVRDMGPDRNRRIVERFPDRIPYVLLSSDPRDSPRLVPYPDGMRALWAVDP